MRKTGIACALLFSLLVLGVSCTKQTIDYSDLASKGAYGQILSESSKRFAQDHSLIDLLWMARSYHESGYADEASQALELYFALAYERQIDLEARRLALQIPFFREAAEQGRVLDELGELDDALATSYYQALLAKGSEAEANDVFARYLSETIAPYTYAEILLRTQAEFSLLLPVLNKLSDEDVVLVMAGASLLENEPERAASLAAITQLLEEQNLEEATRQLLYETLWRLYSQADMRVLANKYRSLAQRVQ